MNRAHPILPLTIATGPSDDVIPTPIIYLQSSLGCLGVNGDTGAVIPEQSSYDDDGEDTLRNIATVNLEEWLVFYSENPFEDEDQFDILDFGYWNTDGTYIEPDYEWRFELCEALIMDVRNPERVQVPPKCTPHELLTIYRSTTFAPFAPFVVPT